MVNMDEFACGGSGETSVFGKTLNPRNNELIPGGSSSGSAAAVAADLCDFALGSDTGGSIRNPASHCGIVGLKPTYGKVSRYGLIDMCMSFDCIGPLVHRVEDAKLILDVIKGQDHFDCTTSEPVAHGKPQAKIGLVDVKGFATPEIAKMIESKTKELAKKNNWEIVKVKLPLNISLETYYLLVYVEFFSGTRKFDGRRFGLSIDKAGGPEVQRRILGGSEITRAEFEGRYYNEALKAKAFIANEFEKIFKKVDVIVLPTVPKGAHKFTEQLTVEEMYAYDVFTVLANIAGIPAISIPGEIVDGKDVGVQLMSKKWNDDLLLGYAGKFGR
jgi:aspartyl-tRNA(Asn)/glutamyl-tRNA(Gln) amidotransferase subunit A